jgi:hypothetical protein
MKISILLIDGNLQLIFCVENVYGKLVDHESISPDLPLDGCTVQSPVLWII